MTHTEKIRYAVGADIGGSHICTAVVDLASGTLCADPVSVPVDCHAGAIAILEAWAEGIRQSVHRSGVSPTCAGLAFPGPFDYRRGISLIRGVDKFDRIYGLDVAQSLRDRLRDVGVGDFRFVNDASAFALGECLGGVVRDAGRVVALTLGTGVGSGFVAEHRLVESGDEVPTNGWVYHLPFENGIVDEAFSTRWICSRYHELTGRKVEGAKQVADRYAEDPAARRLFDEYGERLAAFAGPVLERFHCGVLLLGGNIARAYELFRPALERRFAADGRQVEVHISQLLDRAALFGAASLFL